jgi:hypothetical protein
MADRDLSFLYDRIDRAIGDVINFDAEYKEAAGSVANAYIIEKVNPNGFSPLSLSTTEYTKHLKVSFRVEHPCTGGAATLKVDSITTTPPYPAIKTKDGNNPASSDMPLNSIVDLIYDGTVAPGNFVIERTVQPVAKNVVYVNSIDDLPEESGGKRTLAAYTVYDFQSIPITLNDAKIYFEEGARIINGLITTNQSFLFTEDGSAREIRDTKIIYTGTGTGTEAFFNSDGGDSGDSIIRLLRASIHCQHTSGTMRFFKLASSDPTGIVILDQVAMLHDTPGAASLVGGSFTGLGVLIRNSRLYHYDNGFQFSNNFPGFIISKLEGAFGLNAADSTIVDVSGTQGRVSIQGVGATPQSNESVFYFDPAINWTAGSLDVALCPISLASGGQVFKTGSSDQTNINASFVGNTNIADSAALAEMFFVNNGSATVLSTGIPTKINATWYACSLEKDAPFVTGNEIDMDINGVPITTVLFNTDNDTTLQDLATEIASNTDVSAAITANGNTIFIAPVADTPLEITSAIVTGGASQPTFTFESMSFERFNFDPTGKITYTGLESIKFPLAMLLSVGPGATPPHVCSIFFAKNGQVKRKTISQISMTSAAGLTQWPIATNGFIELVTGDYIEAYIANETNSDNFTVINGRLQGRI